MFVNRKFVIVLLALVLLGACRDGQPTVAPTRGPEAGGTPFGDLAGTATQATIVPPTPTEIPPTPTVAIPVVAYVNGQPLYLPDLEAAVAGRNKGFYGALDPALTDEEAEAIILDRLVEEMLIAQAASASGITVTDETVATEMAELRRLADEPGAGGFEAWLQTNGWTEAELEAVVAQQLLLEQMVAMVTVNVPEAVPQAHARYLQVDDPALAESLLAQLEAGADFAGLAQANSLDRATGEDGGDLGYFAVGTLLVPEVEAAAFALQPGEHSPIVTVTDAANGATTYYLVQLIEMDPARPLTAEARAALLQERFEEWLADLWASAEIVLQLDGSP